jgi:hypothetical protein
MVLTNRIVNFIALRRSESNDIPVHNHLAMRREIERVTAVTVIWPIISHTSLTL